MAISLPALNLNKSQVAPPSDLLIKSEKLLFFRLAFAAVGLALWLAFWLFGSAVFEYAATGGAIAFVLAYSAVGLILMLTKIIQSRKQLNIANAILIGLDVLTLTGLVHFTLGIKSDLYVLYLIPILISSYVSGQRGTYLAALAVSVSYVGVLVMENLSSLPYLVSPQQGTILSNYTSKLWSHILGRSVLLVSVAFIWARFVSAMSRVAREGEDQLREKLEDNNRMVAEIQTQAQREALINSINSALRGTLDLDFILKTAADELARALGVFRCAIVCRLSDTGDPFVCEANPDDPDLAARKRRDLVYFDARVLTFLLNEKKLYTAANLVEGSTPTFLFANPADDERFKDIADKLSEEGYGSLVVQPMMYSNVSKGIIIIAEIDPRRDWAASDLDLARSVAGQVAVAVEQASLIEELSLINEDLTQKNLNLDAKNSELRTMQSQLIHQEKMASLGRLVAGIAHELNNPINFVHGNLPYLKEYFADLKKLIETMDTLVGEREEELKQLKERMKYDFLVTDLDNIIADLEEGAERIRHIIRNLKSFSRLDEADLKEASIHEGIESTLKILSQYYGRDQIPLSKKFGEIPSILCYPGQLNQVWMNLLSNAAQAVAEKSDGKVEVATSVEGNNIVVSVADNGPGIKPEIRSKIFDPFFTTKPVGQGTGLGLSICHSIVERHGGKIEMRSRTNKGTVFTVTLPIHNSPDEIRKHADPNIYSAADF